VYCSSHWSERQGCAKDKRRYLHWGSPHSPVSRRLCHVRRLINGCRELIQHATMSATSLQFRSAQQQASVLYLDHAALKKVYVGYNNQTPLTLTQPGQIAELTTPTTIRATALPFFRSPQGTTDSWQCWPCSAHSCCNG